jgi:hypothetical protein
LPALFTDGLVEDRRQSIDVGLRSVMRALKLRSRHRSLEDTCDVVLGARMQSPDDDVALLLARMGPPAAAGAPRPPRGPDAPEPDEDEDAGGHG